MKKENFVEVNWPKISKYLVSFVLSVLVTWFVYPDFSFTKTDMEVVVVERVGDYTIYKTRDPETTIERKEKNDDLKVGDVVTLKVNVEDNPKYEYNSKIESEAIFIVAYFLVASITFIVGFCKENKYIVSFSLFSFLWLIIICLKWWLT